MRNRKRWALILITIALPLVLFWVIAEKNSWRPRVIQVNLENEWTLAFSPSGARLAYSDAVSGQLQILDIRSRQILKTYEASQYASSQVKFVSENQLVISNEENVWRINLQQQKPSLLLTFTRDDGDGDNGNADFQGSSLMRFLTDNKTLAFTGAAPGDERECRMILYDAATGKRQRSLNLVLPPSRHPQYRMAKTVECSPDGSMIAAGGGVSAPSENRQYDQGWLSGEVWVWDKNGHLKYRLTGHTWAVGMVDFSSQGRLLASACYDDVDNSVRLWDLRTGKLLHALPLQSEAIQLIIFAPDGRTLAIGSRNSLTDDTRVSLWDTNSGELLRTVSKKQSEVRAVVFSPDGSDLAVSSADKTIKLFRVK